MQNELLVSRNLIIHTCCLFPVVDYSVLRICVMAAALWTWSHPLPPVEQMAFEALPRSEVQTFGSGTLLMPKSIRVENIQSILHVVPLWIRESGKQFRRKAARLEYCFQCFFAPSLRKLLCNLLGFSPFCSVWVQVWSRWSVFITFCWVFCSPLFSFLHNVHKPVLNPHGINPRAPGQSSDWSRLCCSAESSCKSYCGCVILA